MALVSDDVARKMSAQAVRGSRGAAVANSGSGLACSVGVLDFVLNGAEPFSHRINIYCQPKPPNATTIPNPKIGDICIVAIVNDDGAFPNPQGVAFYVYNRAVTNAGVVTGTPAWRQLTMA